MTLFVVDVEADGPIPGHYSMVSLGAVAVDRALDRTFYAELRPISERWDPQALAVSGVSREQHLGFGDPAEAMREFDRWIASTSRGRPVLASDNLAFDWQFVNWYFHAFLGRNPFGWSGRRIGDLYCGLVKDLHASWKHLRRTPHDHHPVNDARGDAEALLAMVEMGLKLKL
jgi:hypothetical protein